MIGKNIHSYVESLVQRNQMESYDVEKGRLWVANVWGGNVCNAKYFHLVRNRGPLDDPF